MKQMICTICGMIGSSVATFFGGWTSGMTTLLIFMTVDYVSGLLVAVCLRRAIRHQRENWNLVPAGKDYAEKECRLYLFLWHIALIW